MAKNFKIFKHQTTETLHLKLVGNFDGSSAAELINTLQDSKSTFHQIFVNTSELAIIEPFGKSVFQTRLSDKGLRQLNLKFIGENIGYPLY